jgi:hypothetical protein
MKAEGGNLPLWRSSEANSGSFSFQKMEQLVVIDSWGHEQGCHH